MPAKLLTARAVEAAQPATTRREIPDGTQTGLYLSIEVTGTKSWVLRYRDPNGTSKRRKLGDANAMSVAAARHAAAAARHRIELEPAVAPVAAPRVDHKTSDRIEMMVAQFLELHAYRKTRASTAWATERVFNRLVLPAWRSRSIHDIKRRDVIELIESVATDRPYLANRTLATLSKFYNWLIARDVIETSPVAGVERPHKEQVRNRTLTDAELRALWFACEGDGPFGQALRILVCTGARRNEVSQMRWSELDEERRLWTLPNERSKNAREHTIPLSSQAWAIIQSMSRFAGCDYVFSADGRGPIAGWAKAKTRLSAKAGIAEESWRLHDLRRTCASGMAKLGTSVPVIEKALNHISGTFRGIVGVYQTHDYADEIAIALQRWGNQVAQLTDGKPAKVIPLHGQRP
jgi:integrase